MSRIRAGKPLRQAVLNNVQDPNRQYKSSAGEVQLQGYEGIPGVTLDLNPDCDTSEIHMIGHVSSAELKQVPQLALFQRLFPPDGPIESPVLFSDDWNLLHQVLMLLNPKKAESEPKRQRPTVSEDRAVFHIKSIAGRVLTIMDAMYGSNPIQCEAVKTLIKKEFRAQLNRIFKELYLTDDACMEKESSEDAAARGLEL